MERPRDNDGERLFLLEVLVHELYISHSKLNLNQSLEENFTDTCVLFQFLHYPPLVVCDSDFIGFPTGRKDTSHITFKSGKSCFFSLRVPTGPVLPTPFDISVSVAYKLKENMLPDKLEVGKTSIDMGDCFTQLLSTNMDENCDKLPLSKSKTGTFEIQDEAGKTVGSLKAFIRLSCFGKLVITQFSLNKENEQSYLFKGTDVKQIYRDEEPRRSKTKESGMYSGVVNVTNNKDPTLGCLDRGYNIAQTSMQPRGYEGQQCSPSVYPFAGGVGPSFAQNQACMPQCGNPCECPYSRPETVMSKNVAKSKLEGLEPGQVGIQDDQVIFQLPLKNPGDPANRDKEAESSVYYKLTSAEQTAEGHQKNTVLIKSDEPPEMAGKRVVGPVSGLPIDDGHDVFLLKIGKKCDGDKKRNLELELRTPKMKEPKPPMTDQNTQYLESDIPAAAVDKKPGKGAKGKGKGKKGKK